MEPFQVIKSGDTLGESPVWDAVSGALWWTDIQQSRLKRYAWPNGPVEIFDTPERLCSFGLTENGGLIAAFESGIALYQPETGEIEWLFRLDPRPEGLRFNDGRVDRQGRFWAGTMMETAPPAPKASLYCVEKRRVSVREKGLRIANGACFSPDSSRFYLSDSAIGAMFCYDFDPETGSITHQKRFKTIEKVAPDGADIDENGDLWSAQWGAGRVVRFTPEGEIAQTLSVPARQPTCIAFGGEALDILFVTSARDTLSRDALDREPYSGDVFAYKAGVSGLPAPRFRL